MARFEVLALFVFAVDVIVCEEFPQFRTVRLDEGLVRGEKHWNGDFYEFYEIPYATVPKGRDRFKSPLPPEPWKDVFEAKRRHVICPQSLYSGEDSEEHAVLGEEECLLINLFVPAIADEENLVPVLVYIHSGAFAAGHSTMASFNYLSRNDVLVVSFNFRLGAIGFACLGTEDIPGNAGLKDQVAALRWINKNVRKFGGDPKKVTVAGFSIGAALAELLVLSKSTEGLIDKLILESASALSPFAINRDPVSTARNIAKSFGYNDTGNLRDLNEFYLTATTDSLSIHSLNFFLTNSTFGFAPCIENVIEGVEPFLTESPLDILKSGAYRKVSVLTGFANMEGISRALMFDKWSDKMNENFNDFLPADLYFGDDKTKKEITDEIKKYYFNNEDVSLDTLQGYVDYFSDSMFKYSIMKSLKLHSLNTNRPLFLYEFSYVGELNLRHMYMDRIKGASHRDQSSYVLDFHGWTRDYDDLDMRDMMTMMWTDFVKYEDPTAYESPLIEFKWPKYSNAEPYYLQINSTVQIKKNLLTVAYEFWDKIYEKYHWNPTAPQTKKSKK